MRARIAKTIEYANSIPAEQIDGSEACEIVMQAGQDRTVAFTREDFLKGFSLPNFFFHATMTYALLRQGGVALGKMGFLGAPRGADASRKGPIPSTVFAKLE